MFLRDLADMIERKTYDFESENPGSSLLSSYS